MLISCLTYTNITLYVFIDHTIIIILLLLLLLAFDSLSAFKWITRIKLSNNIIVYFFSLLSRQIIVDKSRQIIFAQMPSNIYVFCFVIC